MKKGSGFMSIQPFWGGSLLVGGVILVILAARKW